jgi:chromosomal replication initiation ATPase DnaA
VKIPVKGTAEAQRREKMAQHACPIPDAVVSCLRRKLGNNRYAAWFSDVVVIASDSGKVTLSAGTRFRSDRINSNYDVDLVQAWQTLDPEIHRVTAIASLPRPQDERTAASSN